MNGVTLPPSPNWNHSTIFASASDGTIAWGSNDFIVIVKKNGSDSKLNYSIIPDAHTEKVNCLAFSPNYGQADKNFLVSGGQKKTIKVWNLDTLSEVFRQSFSDSKQQVVGVDWSKSDHNLIFAVSRDGQLLMWNFTFNSCKTITLGKLTATCLALSPHNPRLVAIGTKSGLIYIVNAQGSGSINYKLRGHDVEITSLSWCPSALNILKTKHSKLEDHLLASGAKDRTIFIWKAGGDGRYEAQLTLPSAPIDIRQFRHRPGAITGSFTAVLWVQPNVLLASSVYGELISTNLSSFRKKEKQTWKLVHGAHVRGIHCISSWVAPVSLENSVKIKEISEEPENWRLPSINEEDAEIEDVNIDVWTVGQDRLVIDCSLTNVDNKVIYKFPTQAGYIYSMAACPLDTSRIAFGAGDAAIRLWNLSEPHERTFDIQNLWQKISGRVLSLAWHPEMENSLAFGTSEGRVGVFDTNKKDKPPTLYRQHHRRCVYTLGWGPTPGNDKKFSLYSCGDGDLACWNPEKPNDQPRIIKSRNCTEFSWKTDMSCLAVGCDDGSLFFLDKKIEEWGKPIFLLKKSIQRIAWHPESTSTDLNLSEFNNFLAVSTSATTITIIDMSNLLEPKTDEKEDVQPQTSYKVFGTLCGHSDRVFCLAWSPHLSGQLISGSADGVVQVWNVGKQEIIGTFVGHYSGVYSTLWSPLDSDLILSGSADFTLRVWRLSEQKVVMPTVKSGDRKTKKKKKSSKAKVMNGQVELGENVTDEIVLNDLGEDSADEIVHNSLQTNGIHDSTLERKSATDQGYQGKDKKADQRKPASYFPNYNQSWRNVNTAMPTILRLAKKAKGLEVLGNDEESPISLFEGPEEVSKMLDKEQAGHWNHSRMMMSTEMSIWNGNLKEHLQKAAETKKLNDFMVSLAPSLSMKFWQEMCETYANQLVQESNPQKAVAYLLSIHKIREAVQVFIDARLFKEAYAIVTSRLGEQDPIVKTFLDEWLKQSQKSGLFEECAQISIISGDISSAAFFLSRRKDPLALQTASELAALDGNKDLSFSIANQAVTEILCAQDYENARKIVEKFESLEFRLIQVEALEELEGKLEEKNLVESWLKGSSYGLLESIKKRFGKLTNVASSYKRLGEDTYASNTPASDSALILGIGRDLALAAAAPDEISEVKHLVSALGTISRYETLRPVKADKSKEDLLIKLLCLLDPVLPTSKNSIFSKERKAPVYTSLRAYLNFGLLNWLVDRLIECPETEEISVSMAVELIQESLENVINKETVSHWMLLAEISKLETNLSTKTDSFKNDEEKNIAIDKLDTLRQKKKSFLAERICAPNPMLVYGKANELASVLLDQDTKTNFSKIIRGLWMSATSS